MARVAPEALWRPDNVENTAMWQYLTHVNQKFNQDLKNTQQLVQWSCDHAQDFWLDLYSYLDLVPALPPSITRAYDDTLLMSENPPFFGGLRINYAENAILSNPDENAIALIGLREDSDEAENVTWREFRKKVRITASALRRSGIKKGDRVAALVATSVWVMVLFHATASIGAIFTSISPELGIEGCVARLNQVSPSIVFMDDATIYKGKVISTAEKLKAILARLDSKPPSYSIPISRSQESATTIHDFLKKASDHDELTFTRVSFNDPLFICYSSGTTGAPKCIVHRHGLILQLKKISILHNTLTYKDVILQYSSTSWIVFYIMCGHFSIGATIICYNGSPFYPETTSLFKLAEKYKVTYFGTSPRYLLEVEMSGCIPKRDFDLSHMRILYCTGSSLPSEQYRWFYRAMPSYIQICNAAGGTDTCTSHLTMDPTGNIYPGEMQIRAIGMDIDIVDGDSSLSVMESGEPGELIIRKPFPSMPCFFWGDHDGSKYRSSYFERFTNIDVWAQHDWISRNTATGGFVMSGRSDGVLNPSGIRFGSGEIYAIVESPPFTDTISSTLCVGRRRPQDRDEQVFLFSVMKPGHSLTTDLELAIRKSIAAALSPRHVPKFIYEVPDIPLTINGKKVEIAVKKTLSGETVVPSATVTNPESIEYFRRFIHLNEQPRAAKL